MDFEKLLSDRESFSAEIRQMIHKALKSTIKGEFSTHKDYPVYITKKKYRQTTMTEGLPILIPNIPNVILDWADIEEKNITHDDLLILDLETTGLSRGGGMIAFMIGIGYYENDNYIVEQYFLPEPDAEINSFDLILPHLDRKGVLVTFNGKSFDLPVLESRFLHNRLWIDLRSKSHIDLLHLARRLWKKKVPSCALETLEYYILGHIRDKELDIEGSIIPQTYFQFLINGDPELLQRIFIHNQTDVLHTAALFAMICEQIDFPLPDERDIRIDYHAVGKLYQSQGRKDEAKQILTALADEHYITPELVYDLGILHKKDKAYGEAESFFRQGTDLLHNPSMLELSILLEQKNKDFESALMIAEALLGQLLSDPFANDKKRLDLEKRIERLKVKMSKPQKAQKTRKQTKGK
jgi:uncharacterized protein YprB with RNaseH-like and TPR domain